MQKKMGSEVLENLTAPNNGSAKILTTVKAMVIFVPVLLKDIFEQERDFVWERPPCCPRCDHYKVWSHGFVERIFDGFDSTLSLKCYRCPFCGCVITLQPDTHFPRFQASKDKIRSFLSARLKTGRWPPAQSHSSHRHWLRNLKKQIKALLSDIWDKGILAAFDHLVSIGHTPVSSSI
ncbi:MAG: hypothetical protein E3J46_12590 [Desulfobacteraceae bacterium]|nr:MAG: hypothetical protein E3J46_12590 [Desulfobacteraceae bacterium]